MAGYIGKSQGVTQVDGYNRTEADDRYVNASGDTMTGALGIGTAAATSPSTMLHVREDDSVDHIARIAVQSADQMLVAGSKWQAGVEQYSFLKSTNAAETVGQPMRIQIGDNTALGIDSAGRVTMPYQPAFLAYSDGLTFSAYSGAVTAFTTIQHNIGNYYNNANGTFTAPVSGAYMFWANSRTADNLSSRNEKTRFRVNGVNLLWTEIWTGETYDSSSGRAGQVNLVTLYLSANDAVQLDVTISDHYHLAFGGYLIG